MWVGAGRLSGRPLRRMSYITQDQLIAYVQQTLLEQGLDDNADGVVDAAIFSQILETAEQEVHSFLEGRYSVPFGAPVPAIVILAVKSFCAEAIWTRRGNTGDQNPFSKPANGIRDRLGKIQDGTNQLRVGQDSGAAAGAVVAEDSMFSGGRMAL
jgi:phage gp36-like protein